ncbi:hypothetical protein GcM1_185007 [Golovinomyces cichoracearum]|uniref:Uncharacterized protein n=1 Tax=Golovinomyces cichoracearum TaxID=62708 RepID=A0A420J356_9PEZI|nr:hypothetical protein GcM1_185007 [Golovinomyces cichoracearum]
MDVKNHQRAALRRHLELGGSLRDPSQDRNPVAKKRTPPVSIIIERTPGPNKSEKCALSGCLYGFTADQYRIAVTPAMNKNAVQNMDLYHVSCFEKIADLSDSALLNCIEPYTRQSNFNKPEIEYVCAGGVERLVLEWKTRQLRLSALKKKNEETDQKYDDEDVVDYDEEEEEEEEEEADEEIYSQAALKCQQSPERLLNDLLYNAGSSRFKPYDLVPGMERQQYLLLLKSLAPWESDGPNDKDEWNLFNTFLGPDESNKTFTYDRVKLSVVLDKWKRWRDLALTPDNSLSHERLLEKASIGEKGCRAIRRLSVIPIERFIW